MLLEGNVSGLRHRTRQRTEAQLDRQPHRQPERGKARTILALTAHAVATTEERGGGSLSAAPGIKPCRAGLFETGASSSRPTGVGFLCNGKRMVSRIP